MRVLLLHPEDFPGVGPWSRERWDLIVDLGKSSQFSADAWARQSGCRVLRAESFREGVADVRRVREMFSPCRGHLVDEAGIDWWDLTSLQLAQHALAVLVLRRLAAEIDLKADLWATRSGGTVGLLAALLERQPRTFGSRGMARSASEALRYAGLARRFSAAQIKEIALDKYDSAYRWRSRVATRRGSCAAPVVLMPSAYGNVSRMGAAYARLLPQQSFLTVATRQSGRQFEAPPNVQVRDLAAYAKTDPPRAEIAALLDRWAKLKGDLDGFPDLLTLSRAGALDPVPGWIRDWVSVRDAWHGVLDREPVCGVLCGDDSNPYTLLPVLLAARRGIPTADFHHGAFDGRYLLKDLRCDVYLAKNAMERDYLVRVCGLPEERVVIGAPSTGLVRPAARRESPKTSAIFFSEPYEGVGMRAQEVYRELLPRLCRLARANGHGVTVKLHPFESLSQRRRMIREVLTPEDGRLLSVVDGPLTEELMSQAWFGITIESTAVIDCLRNGIQCFLCGWFTLWPFEYAQQYSRFGVGEVLPAAADVESIPTRLADFENRVAGLVNPTEAVNPALLLHWLTAGAREPADVRPVS